VRRSSDWQVPLSLSENICDIGWPMIRNIHGKHVVLGLDGSRRYAIQAGISAADSYRRLPEIVERATQRLLGVHDVGALSVWLLQEYNLRRGPDVVDVLIDIAVECVIRLKDMCASPDLQLCLVGELAAVDQIRPGCLDSVVPRGCETPNGGPDGAPISGPKRIYLMVGYNHDKEFSRAMARCTAVGLDAPSMSDLATRWCIPPVNVLMRTGQLSGMVNLSAYWPGLERGRIISTPLYPQQLTDDEIDRLVELYMHGVDSSSAMTESSPGS
jgi:hypothetical protein